MHDTITIPLYARARVEQIQGKPPRHAVRKRVLREKCEKLPFVEKEKILRNFFVLENLSASTPRAGRAGDKKKDIHQYSSYEFVWLQLCKSDATAVPLESKTL